MTLADKLEGLAAIARANPADLRNIKWRLLYLVAEIDAANPPPSFIDDLLDRSTPINLSEDA